MTEYLSSLGEERKGIAGLCRGENGQGFSLQKLKKRTLRTTFTFADSGRAGRLSLVVTACCLLFVVVAQAQPRSHIPGMVVRPVHPGIPLRDSAPGTFGLYGSQTGETRTDNLYLIREGRQVPRFFRNEVWINVIPVPQSPLQENQTPPSHWVYWGDVDPSTNPNFRAVNPEEIPEVPNYQWDVNGWIDQQRNQWRE